MQKYLNYDPEHLKNDFASVNWIPAMTATNVNDALTNIYEYESEFRKGVQESEWQVEFVDKNAIISECRGCFKDF